MAKRKTTELHGETQKGGIRSSEYAIWMSVRQRCNNSNSPAYKYYGGRGISVCSTWDSSFIAFLNDMGRKPTPEHSLDRVDNDGDYNPKNCRWATRAEQARNRRVNHKITAHGRTRCVVDWAKDLDVSPSLIVRRLKRGWPSDRAVSEPPERRCSHKNLTVDGKTLTVQEWSREPNAASSGAIHHRLSKGWSQKAAIFTPPYTRSRGRPSDVFIILDGESDTINGWAKKVGLKPNTIRERLRKGWGEKEAIVSPLGTRKNSL